MYRQAGLRYIRMRYNATAEPAGSSPRPSNARIMAESHDAPKQPNPFDPQRSALLDDPAREAWLPTDAIVAHLDIPRDARVLDYGAGTGRYAIAIARSHPDATIVAYDVQPEMAQLARERISAANVVNATSVSADSDVLRHKSFERIIAVNVLHEIGGEDLARIRALVNPNGMVLVIDWDAAVKRDVGPPANHVYSASEAADRLERAGLRVEKLDDSRFPHHYVLRARR